MELSKALNDKLLNASNEVLKIIISYEFRKLSAETENLINELSIDIEWNLLDSFVILTCIDINIKQLLVLDDIGSIALTDGEIKQGY